MKVRALEDRDVEAACRVLVASITELCGEDHGGDPGRIAAWTANKTTVIVRRWLADPSTSLLIAEVDGSAAGIAACATSGEILLNYVSPEFRFRGVSRALLSEMERRLRAQGVATGRLTSTVTAHRFYLAVGWMDAGLSGDRLSFRMEKSLG
jgi:GNAT superfamily N-acetyltransferase